MFTSKRQTRYAENEQKSARRFGHAAVGVFRRFVGDVVGAHGDLDRLRGWIGRVGDRVITARFGGSDQNLVEVHVVGESHDAGRSADVRRIDLLPWRKMTVMNAPTIEARIRAYLSLLDNETGRTGRITIPLDRERMAEYLGVSRAALSRSLGMMRDRGLLTWRKNVFRLNF